jgi:tRNA G18 (ribose-2'-O)-methylase SpoU
MKKISSAPRQVFPEKIKKERLQKSAPHARHGKVESVLLLHNMRSVFNIGALFRTADAIGVHKIVLSGYSPTPVDRFGRARNDLAKCALGAEKSVPWEYVKTPLSIIKKYQAEGFTVVGLEQDARSVDYKKVPRLKKVLIVLGTETTGMTTSLRNACDVIAEIPMHGMKESLNVSVAGGIMLYRLLDR